MKITRLFLIIFVLTFTFHSSFINNSLSDEVDVVGDDEYAVYSAVLLQIKYLNPSPELFVINQTTTNSYPGGEKIDAEILVYVEEKAAVELDVALIEDFKNKNNQTRIDSH